jgi:acyl-CoA thioester hydrolase
MDCNQHMRNSAYLGCAEQCRMEFLDAHGWPMSQFLRLQLGPVVLEDRLVYRRELGLLDGFRVELEVAAATDDWRRMRLRNRFVATPDERECGVLDSVVLWMDLATRRPVVPPHSLRAIWATLARTDDYEQW